MAGDAHDDEYATQDDKMNVDDTVVDPFQAPPDTPPLAPEAAPKEEYLDDVDRMVCHEDFPHLLVIASKIKKMRESMQLNEPQPSSSSHSREMDPNDVIAAVTRIQNQFVSSTSSREPIVVSKGMYPITDSMMDESYQILQKELERCETWYQEREHMAVARKSSTPKRRKANGDGGEVIAVKYSKWQTDILMDWMIRNADHPFPDAEQIKQLGQVTGLAQSQVINWTTNVRKRNLKATVENGKKPHHFLDFLFLAQDRERREAQGLSPSMHHASSTPKRNRTTMMATPQHPYSAVLRGESEHPTVAYPLSAAGAFRPTAVYYSPAPSPMMQQQHHHQPGYLPYYQYPFPPPPPAVHQHHPSPGAAPPPEEDEWERKLRVVSESFDDDGIPDPVTSMGQENPDPLAAFAEFWKGDEDGSCVNDGNRNHEEITSSRQACMEDGRRACAKRERPDVLESVELLDLDDDLDFQKIMEV